MEMDCKDKYNLDHVYCHTNENYIRTTTSSDSGSGSSTSTDILAIIKENRQLKAMLLLHLDLIQEQSDQLMAKDKMITSLKDELESSKRRGERLEKQLNHLKVTMNAIQQQQQQHQIQQNQQNQQNQQKHIQQQEFTSKTNSLNNNLIEKVSPVSKTARLSETALLSKRESSNLSPTMPAQMAHNYEQLQKQSKYKICDEIFDNDSIIGERNGKFISKIILQRVPMSKGSIFMNQTTSTSTSATTKSTEGAVTTEGTTKSSAALLDPSATQIKVTLATTIGSTATTTSTMKTKSTNFMTIPATKQSTTTSPNEIKTKHKEMEITDEEDVEEENNIDDDDEDEEEFETHENNSKTGSESVYSPLGIQNDLHNHLNSSKTSFCSLTTKNEQIDTEDSFSCGSGEQDQHHDHDVRDDHHHFHLQIHNRPSLPQKRTRHQSSSIMKYSSRKYNILTTKRHYPTREWEWDHVNEETNSKDEAEALKSETPNLEIPKWTIKEFTGLYSIEGTEDLSDDIFLKRHAKLEYDEKRRKKWDVQRIREQRTIERLKRRHCKDEVPDSEVNNEITSFFPTADSIKYIYLTEDLPVQAFGDTIPRLPSTEFNLPWQSYNFHRKLTQQSSDGGVNNSYSDSHYQKSTSLLSSAIVGSVTASSSNNNILNNTINNSNSITTLDNIGNSCSSNNYPFGHNPFSSIIEVVESPQSTLTFMKKRRKQSSQSQTTSQNRNLSKNLRKLNRNN